MNLRNVFGKYQTKVGMDGGEQMNVFRPNYATTNNTLGSPTIQNRMMRAAGQANKFTEPNVSGALFYNVFGQREGIAAGDVLAPQESGTGTPVMTVATISSQKAISAFMTDRTGKITSDLATDVFTSVLFAWLPITFPGSNLEQNMAGSLGISTRKAVLYKRNGIKRKMRLVDAGDDAQVWEITDLITVNNVMVLNLSLGVE
jgi:hypothetical protein